MDPEAEPQAMTGASTPPRGDGPGPARIDVRIDGPRAFRGTEIIGDLRVVAETLFYPFAFVAFWDGQTGNHLCPQTQAGKPCTHPPGEAGRAAYAADVETALSAELEVRFPHAGLSIFLG